MRLAVLVNALARTLAESMRAPRAARFKALSLAADALLAIELRDGRQGATAERRALRAILEPLTRTLGDTYMDSRSACGLALEQVTRLAMQFAAQAPVGAATLPQPLNVAREPTVISVSTADSVRVADAALVVTSAPPATPVYISGTAFGRATLTGRITVVSTPPAGSTPPRSAPVGSGGADGGPKRGGSLTAPAAMSGLLSPQLIARATMAEQLAIDEAMRQHAGLRDAALAAFSTAVNGPSPLSLIDLAD